ncbi:hypothetical protein M3Y94_00335200 [Aphelenchoides besseyi]|nr:hypothetical protein M3Y94_00335200 [Aphelenchoides besseyi]
MKHLEQLKMPEPFNDNTFDASDQPNSARTLETPVFLGISPTVPTFWMNTMPNNAPGDLPSTAEIIQKCLNVNPFDVKFREANMQINGQTPEQATEQRVTNGQLALPTTPAGLTMLKLPSSLSQSPNLFSNVFSAADIGDELRKNIDINRKLQQLRDTNHLVKQEGNRTPCTADVLNAVLDMNMNQQALAIPSTSSLVAGLTAAAAAVANSTTSTVETSTTSVNRLVVPTISSAADPVFTIDNSAVSSTATASTSSLSNNGFALPSSNNSASISQAGLAASTAAALLQQQTSIANMISHQSTLNALNTPANQSMPNLHAGFQSTVANSGPASNGLMAPRASPALSNISPRSTSHLMELHKNSNGVMSNDPHRAASVDPWDSSSENYSMYEATHGRLELKTDSFGGMNPASSESSLSSQPNSHMTADIETKPHRKYARYHASNPDGTPSSRGGRGRRSITSEMPPDERRMTILERNKAAAVRYRKRKKEEHDEMIGRVTTLEQDKVYFQTQNTVLRREVERLTEIIKHRDAHCVCRAANNLSLFNPENGDAGTSSSNQLTTVTDPDSIKTTVPNPRPSSSLTIMNDGTVDSSQFLTSNQMIVPS